jgi:hypothetical protein
MDNATPYDDPGLTLDEQAELLAEIPAALFDRTAALLDKIRAVAGPLADVVNEYHDLDRAVWTLIDNPDGEGTRPRGVEELCGLSAVSQALNVFARWLRDDAPLWAARSDVHAIIGPSGASQ